MFVPTVLIGKSFSSSTVCGLRVQVDIVFLGADFYGAGGKNQVLSSDRGDNIVGRKPFGL